MLRWILPTPVWCGWPTRIPATVCTTDGHFECQKSIDRAAKLARAKRITHHDLRHLFATRFIENGVDIPRVSRWLAASLTGKEPGRT
ncbi:MAG TPA: tyrosine-type recombinase/integrase [Candidatus Baltobacteraceae bacterium]|nr:tyrosine-type recombinase/integrase [Candidatus Baltobacteraceae bacterium]